MAGNLIDNSAAFLAELKRAKARALETIGQKAEAYAKDKCPKGTEESTGKKGYIGGTLQNSITHRVDDDVMSLGSNVEYAPYPELGTGPHFEAPPEWEQFTTTRGSGIGKSFMRPHPYLRPAIEDHREEYKEIMRDELSGG